MIKFEPLQTLKFREFRNLILGRLFMVISFRMLSTLLAWWIYILNREPGNPKAAAYAIGIIGLSEVIPAVSMALYAGHVIDNSEKKRLLLITNYLYFFLISLFILPAFFNFNLLHFSKKEVSYFIYGVIFFTGILRAFLGPIVSSMVPKTVPRESLPNAITLTQGTFLTASVFGHAIGGFLIALIEIKGTLLVILSLLLLASFFYWQVNKHPSEIKEKADNVFDSMFEGMRYIFRNKTILGAVTLDLFAVLFGGIVALIPIFASDILKVGSQGFGMLNAATDIGSMCVILTLSIFPLRRNQGKILLFAVAGFGLCIILFGISKIFWLSFILLVLSGMLDGISVVVRHTILQLKTPDEIRGRVLSANSIFINSSNELGQFESGAMARIFGVIPSVVIGGSLTMLAAIFVGTRAKELREMEY